MTLSFSALASLTAFSTRCCSSAFCLLSCVIALSLSMVSVRFCTKALSCSFSAFCLSSTNAFVRFSTSLLTASGKAFFMRSFSAVSLTFSFSITADLPTPTRLPTLSRMLSTLPLRMSSRCFSFSAISLSSCKRLRGCVLTCFQWFPTFVFQNPNESKNGDKRNGHISSSRKTI